MRVGLGNAGWVRVEDSTLAGTLYIRFDITDDKRPVMREIFESRLALAGIDVHRLAAHYSTTWGSGTYAGDSCKTCDGPVKRRNLADGSKSVRAVRNWAALSWYAQFEGSGIPQISLPRERDKEALELEDFPDIEPPSGGMITDDFLAVIGHAYKLARAKRVPPAPTIGRLAGVSPRTVHKWVAKAREREFLPRGSQGKTG